MIALVLNLAAIKHTFAQSNHIADKPLFHDPVYDGAADPAIIWNKKAKKWWMLYTNRRATDENAKGVTWVHGTRIGIAESADGAHWKYVDTANINYRPDSGFTHWAPALIENKGLYHMYLTYVPGTFTDWNHPRVIVHLTSKDLRNWKYEAVLKLVNEKVIDPYVVKLPDGTWRMFYNNEKAGKSIYYADSKDLYNWTDKGQAVHDMAGEGPIAFSWKGHNWLIVDNWKGLGVYSSDDWLNWKRQEARLVEKPGTGKEDNAKGDHADVVISNDRAYLFYFVEVRKRSWIQVTELKYNADGTLSCDRDAPTEINLTQPK
ncbi:family 43 glycosylhydrolase [Mucilaginibacter mali]|uniref:Family 43 glycosylhydrolase n=2 Tax=Mucilaginibacter mali TaxID=2740462 RepID=A0A7D4PX89_9SPHI|nr:family 43 glycosylhydrolase [Mucilaginibacter mali]